MSANGLASGERAERLCREKKCRNLEAKLDSNLDGKLGKLPKKGVEQAQSEVNPGVRRRVSF